MDRHSLPFSKEHGEKIKRGLVSISPCFFLWIGRVAKPWTGFACAGALADGSDPRAVPLPRLLSERRDRPIASSLNPGLLGMPPNRSKIRRGETPKVGVTCENPSLDRKQPTSLSNYVHIYFKTSSSFDRILSVTAFANYGLREKFGIIVGRQPEDLARSPTRQGCLS